MKNIPIVDAHHHLWDLNNEHTKYSWLMVKEGEAFFGDYAAIRKSYLLEDYIKDAQNQNLIKSVHVQAEHDDDKPINETAWLQSLADTHSSYLELQSLGLPSLQPYLIELLYHDPSLS